MNAALKLDCEMYLERRPRFNLEGQDREVLLPTINLGEAIRSFGQILSRRRAIVICFMAMSVVLAVLYAFLATPLYTANGSLLIDPRAGRAPNDQTEMIPGLLLSDALTVDSETRVLLSRDLTGRVVTALGIKAATDSVPSLTQRVSRFFGLEALGGQMPPISEVAAAERRAESLRKALVKGLVVERSGESFVIDISYTSSRLEFAPIVINTLMKEYLKLSGEQNVTTADRTRGWLAGRIDELGNAVQTAERAVADFRQENKLEVPSGAQLPTEIALNASIAELIKLKADSLALDVQVKQLREQLASGNLAAVQLAPEEQTQALQDFQARLAELQQIEREQLLVWGDDVLIIINTRNQQVQTRDLIDGEYRRIVERLEARTESMSRLVAATDKAIEDLRAQYGIDAYKNVQVRSLEREADAKRILYERLLEEYNSTSQMLTFDSSSARVIAWAVTPESKSAPKSRLVLVMALFGGFVLAAGTVAMVEALDNSFRLHSDLTQSVGINFLGVIPAFGSDKPLGGSATAVRPIERSARWNKLSKIARKFDFAAVNPNSASAETMRSIHVRLTMTKNEMLNHSGGFAVGVVSSVRDEGKTTAAFNLASYLASQRERVAIIDLDLISSEMSQEIESLLPKTNNWRSVMEDPEAAVRNLMPIAELPNLTVIGNIGADKPRGLVLRDMERIQAAMQVLRENFDYIVIDMPPVQGAADTQLLASLCDRLIFAIKWGATPKEQVSLALLRITASRDKIFGVVFTQANLMRYRAYNRHDVTDYNA